MKTHPILLATLFLTSHVHARLGETLTQARTRYGMEQHASTNRNGNVSYTTIHERDDMRIQIRFSENIPGETKAIEVIYTKLSSNTWDLSEAEYLLGVNREGRQWGEARDSMRYVVWDRNDGGRAIYDKQQRALSVARPEKVRPPGIAPKGLEGL